MKILLLFALFGLSFYQASGDKDCPTPSPTDNPTKKPPTPNPTSPNCLADALKLSADLLKDAGEFLCELKSCKKGGPSMHFKELAGKLIQSVGKIGCDLELILRPGTKIDDLLKEVAETTCGSVGPLVYCLVEALGIPAGADDALCLVATLLGSGCFKNYLLNMPPKTTINTAKCYCEENAQSELKELLSGIMENSGCVLKGVQEITTKTLKELVGSLGGLLKPVVKCLLQLTEKFPSVDNSLCSLLHSLLGEDGIVQDSLKDLLGNIGLLGRSGFSLSGFPTRTKIIKAILKGDRKGKA